MNTSEVVLFQVNVSNAGPMQMTLGDGATGGPKRRAGARAGSFEDSAESDVYPTIEAHDAE